MNILSVHAAGVVPKSIAITAQKPSQTELSNKGLSVDGSRTEVRTYEVMETALSAFIATQLAAGSVEDKQQVVISANSDEGGVYSVTVTVNALSESSTSPSFSIAEGFMFIRPQDEDSPSGPSYPTVTT